MDLYILYALPYSTRGEAFPFYFFPVRIFMEIGDLDGASSNTSVEKWLVARS